MAPRLELQALLRSVLGSDNVYFQPPPTVTMQYPCIVYSRDDRDTRHANNQPYAHRIGYQVTVIDRNPDSLIPDKVADLPFCEFQRTYTADNLNHDVYKLFF
jgi:hypothetical protein